LKSSNVTWTPAKATANGPSSSDSARNSRHTRPVESFSLAGVSDPPDPATHAYRKDLADTALAGRVIASHYAEPLIRHLVAEALFRTEPTDVSESVAQLKAGDEILMLDLSRGWAWGYGPDGRVGYVRAEAVGS
jgi:hypothetical protein